LVHGERVSTIAGVMVERRDQVLMIFLSPVSTALFKLPCKAFLHVRPFLMDRPTSNPFSFIFRAA